MQTLAFGKASASDSRFDPSVPTSSFTARGLGSILPH